MTIGNSGLGSNSVSIYSWVCLNPIGPAAFPLSIPFRFGRPPLYLPISSMFMSLLRSFSLNQYSNTCRFCAWPSSSAPSAPAPFRRRWCTMSCWLWAMSRKHLDSYDRWGLQMPRLAFWSLQGGALHPIWQSARCTQRGSHHVLPLFTPPGFCSSLEKLWKSSSMCFLESILA